MSGTSQRSDGDSWDLASGVGATATAVAASRALATRSRLIDDQLAEPLVRAVGMAHYIDILDGKSDTGSKIERMAEGMAVRTRFFDAFLIDAMTAGVRQSVILASGLDARAYRLSWPDDMVVYEIDQPQVMEFKAAALAALGAPATAEVHNVGVDLRDDWGAALCANGFDAQLPTAWIAEGLLMYLPGDAQDRLLDRITSLSPTGSRLATEFFPNMDAFSSDGDRWKKLGFRDDIEGLVYGGERSHVVDYLRGLGWEVTGQLVRDLFDAYGIEHHEDEMSAQFEGVQYLSATLA